MRVIGTQRELRLGRISHLCSLRTTTVHSDDGPQGVFPWPRRQDRSVSRLSVRAIHY